MSNFPKLTLTLIDRDGHHAESNTWWPSLSSVAEAVSIAQTVEGIINQVSNARVEKARWTLTVPPTTTTTASPETNIYERLVILFTDGVSFASYSLPAPADGAYDTQGPYRDIRIQAGPHPIAQAIEQLQMALSETVLADGTPFPVGDWVAGRTANQ